MIIFSGSNKTKAIMENKILSSKEAYLAMFYTLVQERKITP